MHDFFYDCDGQWYSGMDGGALSFPDIYLKVEGKTKKPQPEELTRQEVESRSYKMSTGAKAAERRTSHPTSS